MTYKNIAVLISGMGSNLKALIDAQNTHNLGCVKIACVVSNRRNAGGLIHANNAHIPTHVYNLVEFCGGKTLITSQKRIAYDQHLARTLNEGSFDLIVLAGWMHIFSAEFLNEIKVPVINLHPALPNQFAGANGIEEAYEAWQQGQITHTGCMVHEVIEEIDAGRVLATQMVPCIEGDSLEDLKHRMHHAEHQLIVNTVRDYFN